MFCKQSDIHTIDNCRFCFMCRHVCPIAMVTGKEIHNARARAELLSMVLRGREYTADLAATQYECALCGACTEQCATAFDPLSFTKAARLEAVLGGIEPERVACLIQRILETGSPYDIAETAALTDAIRAHADRADTLLLLGSARTLWPDGALAAIRLMRQAGETFAIMEREPYSGGELADIMGAAEEAREMAVRAAEALNQTGCKTIVCVSPDSARMFLRAYRQWGIELNVRIKTFTSVAADWLNRSVLRPLKREISVTLQDSYHLARELDEVEPSRVILNACAELREMFRHGRQTISCGEGALALYMPELSRGMSRRRLQDVPDGVTSVITNDPHSAYLLSEVGELPVWSIEQWLWECVKGETSL